MSRNSLSNNNPNNNQDTDTTPQDVAYTNLGQAALSANPNLHNMWHLPGVQGMRYHISPTMNMGMVLIALGLKDPNTGQLNTEAYRNKYVKQFVQETMNEVEEILWNGGKYGVDGRDIEVNRKECLSSAAQKFKKVMDDNPERPNWYLLMHQPKVKKATASVAVDIGALATSEVPGQGATTASASASAVPHATQHGASAAIQAPTQSRERH